MEKQVLFRDNQEVQAKDYNDFQDFARASFDHVVKDGIQDAKGWVDFQVTETGTAEITVSPGRIYNAGAGYISETDAVFDLLSSLPATNKKWVAVVAWGSEEETDVQPRDFLIDASNGATEPDPVPMLTFRKANVATVVGVEAPQPVKPPIDSSNIVVAWVLLDTTGVDTITMEAASKLPQVARVSQRTDALELWRTQIGPTIESLRSDLARVNAQLAQMGTSRLIDQVAIDVARLKEFTELDDGYTDYGADRFLDVEESDTEDVNYLAKVEEGLRFSDDAADIEALEVFNPFNPDVTISNGFLLPKYTETQRLKVGPFNEELSVAQYQFQTHDMVQKTKSKVRIRYGEEKTVCTNNSWWKSGRYDQAQGVFFKDGETWQVVNGIPNTVRGGTVKHVRLRRFWKDTYTVHYWDRIKVDHSINGQQIAQTFVNGADGWLTSIGLYFTQKGPTGNVDLALAEVTDSGTPDLKGLIGKVTLDVANILTSGDATVETKVAFPATFLEAGKRYAVVITTGGNHFVGMALGTQFAQGTFFNSLDGAYLQGTANKDLMFALYFAKFDRTRTVVDLEAMSLSGGIAAIDVLAPAIAPESCDLTFEVQVSGAWTPLGPVDTGNTILFGLPPLLPFRAVFTGTSDVQPGIDLVNSVLRFSRPRTTFKHLSTEYTLASSTQDFKVIALLENYFEDNHNLTCTIRADGGGGEINPATTVDAELDPPDDATDANHKRIRRTFTWTATELNTPIDTVRITLDGATTSALDTFHAAERVHLALSPPA